MAKIPSQNNNIQFCSKCGSEIFPHEDYFIPVECGSCKLLQVRPFKQDELHFEKLIATSPLFNIFRGYHSKHKLFLEITVLRKDIKDYEYNEQLVRDLANKLTSLSHVNICPLFSHGKINEYYYVSSPRMDGYKLSHYDSASHGLMDINRALEVLQATALGLAVAHYHNFAHHNVCPENIQIDSRGMVRIRNFFLSRFVYAYDQRRIELNNKIYISVSPHYISPEKAESGVEDHRGDIFSFGVLMYYMLTGEFPFQGTKESDTIYTRIKKTRKKDQTAIFNSLDETIEYIPPVPPKQKRNAIPDELSKLNLQMLSYFPKNRPALTEVISLFNLLRAKLDVVKIRSIQENMVDTETKDIPKMNAPGQNIKKD